MPWGKPWRLGDEDGVLGRYRLPADVLHGDSVGRTLDGGNGLGSRSRRYGSSRNDDQHTDGEGYGPTYAPGCRQPPAREPIPRAGPRRRHWRSHLLPGGCGRDVPSIRARARRGASACVRTHRTRCDVSLLSLEAAERPARTALRRARAPRSLQAKYRCYDELDAERQVFSFHWLAANATHGSNRGGACPIAQWIAQRIGFSYDAQSCFESRHRDVDARVVRRDFDGV